MPPINLLIKPASGSCNLRCKYCFYKDEMLNRETAVFGRMSDETLKTLIKKSMEYAEQSITFAFQGGEPTLMGIDFYKKFCELKEKYNTKNLEVHCSIQTNGTLLDKEWARFFAKEKFLVGLSIDGPRSIHDQYRVSVKEEGTFQTVMRTARLLTEEKVDFNILTVLTENGAKDIERIYKFFMSKNFLYQQYIPCLEPLREDEKGQGYSLTSKTYGTSLKALFDLWFTDVTNGIPIYNRFFENLVGLLAGHEPESCDMKGFCSIQYVTEADGGIYPCDFYALDEYKIGNILEDSFERINENRNELQFIHKSKQVHETCRECEWLRICRGGCRRNRDDMQENELGLNRFCAAYQEFFAYAINRLKYLADSIKR